MHPSKHKETLDLVSEIVSEHQQREIEALRARLKELSEEAGEFLRKYAHSHLNNVGVDLFSDAHDLHDWLYSVGE